MTYTDETITSVYVAMTDLAGQLIGKRCSRTYFDRFKETGFGLCDLMLGQDITMQEVAGSTLSGNATGYRDMTLRPDLTTGVPLPWRPGDALVLADCCDPASGSPLNIAPRSILREQLRRLAKLGLGMRAASEIEFYIFDRQIESTSKTGLAPSTPLTQYDSDGHISQLSRYGEVWRDIETHFRAIGLEIDYIKFEGGRGQAEIVLTHDLAHVMADRHALYKFALRDIAALHGKSVSFMAKPFADEAGSSGHIHYSLYALDTGDSVMQGGNEGGLSDTAEAFLAGQLMLTRQISAFLAPTINSYKRFTRSFLSPDQVSWGVDDRDAAYRVVGNQSSKRVECRIPGADINPYLAYAALIAAGLEGVSEGARLKDVPRSAPLPRSLSDAIKGLRDAAPLKEAFGADVLDHYIRYVSFEVAAYEQAVTDWERRRYFDRI
ncbi:MAG: glutamine synthetase family protein [Pseudomonadota bacterium]